MSRAREILVRAHEIMSDPKRVVLNPDNLYETAAGSPEAWVEDAERVCLMGSLIRATYELGYEPYGADHSEARKRFEPFLPSDSYTDSLGEHGHKACADALARAIQHA